MANNSLGPVDVGGMAAKQTASMEDYLEAIVILAEEDKPVSVTEIAKALGVTKPSVTSALAKLSEAGLVRHEKYGKVVLTSEGGRLAQNVYQRHRTLHQFLVEILKVDSTVAEEDACRTEHSLSATSLNRLAKFLEFVLNCPRGEPEWLKGFSYYLEHGKRHEELLARCQRQD